MTRLHSPFRVLYDLRWMQLGVAGGIEQATYELIDAIARLDRRNSYRLLAPRSACWEWQFPDRFKVERVYSEAGERRGEMLHEAIQRHKMEGSDAGFDLVHSTCSYIHPELIDLRGVVTMHDLQHLHHPEFFSAADHEMREALYRESARRARQVICISEFTRRDVHERYGVPLERLSTIWNIPSGVMAGTLEPGVSTRAVRALGIEGPYFFYPAQAWPHKNHAGAVEAFIRALPDLPRDVTLLFAGRALAADHPAIDLMRSRGLGARVVHVGLRSALEIRALLQQCTALFFPSLFEGFGMPVAEAILAGKPIACSNLTSLPEIAGDAALYFDPRDPDAMAASMVALATQPQLRQSLSQAALGRRRLFSAHTSAVRTLAVYEKAMLQ